MKKIFDQIKQHFKQNAHAKPAINALSKLEKDSSISAMRDYPSFCELAAKDSKVFENFRINPIYTNILEHVKPELGQRYLDVVLSRNHLSQQEFEKLKANDLYGGGGNNRLFSCW